MDVTSKPLTALELMADEVKEIEEVYVKDAYNCIANEFDKTRHCHWKGVVDFVNSLTSGCHVLDAGCGNGKNMQIRMNDIKYTGCDISEKLVEICKKKELNVILANIKALPFDNEFFDAVVCIAVLHHIALEQDRLGALEELLRVLKPGGKLLFQVWAREQELTSRFIPIQIKKNDFFVTWKSNDEIIKRYYHLFSEVEIKILLSQLYNIKVISISYEKDNWSIILQKN